MTISGQNRSDQDNFIFIKHSSVKSNKMEEKLSVHKQTNKDPKLQFEVVVSQKQEMLL